MTTRATKQSIVVGRFEEHGEHHDMDTALRCHSTHAEEKEVCGLIAELHIIVMLHYYIFENFSKLDLVFLPRLGAGKDIWNAFVRFLYIYSSGSSKIQKVV